MSSSRVSFGSRAGGASDYPVGQHADIIRASAHSGAYHSLDALSDALKSEIAATAEADAPECTTLELSLSADAVLELVRPGVGPYSEGGQHDLPSQFKRIDAADVCDIGEGEGGRQRHPRALVGNMINVVDPRQSAIVQRAASRGVIQAIEKVDGFRYSFNNAWAAKDGEGSRFSYICQDSMQNKDRHANGYPRTTKHLKSDVGSRGPRKPTYDCKGSVSIKFSTAKQRCDVYYRHYAIHSTVADRAQQPRPQMLRRHFVSREPLVSQVEDSDVAGKGGGGLLATLQAESYASSALAMVNRTEPSNIGRPLKRKRESAPFMSKSTSDTTLSLVELLSQSASAKAPPTAGDSGSKQQRSHLPAPIAYDVPSWQTPPPPLSTRPAAGYPAPYQPPYQPTKSRVPLTPVAQAQRQQVQQQPTFRQKSSGQPTGSHPRAQGLFTTLKPIASDHVTTPVGPVTPPPLAPTGYGVMQPLKWRARRSCVRCRLGKRKCDEGQPCSACIKGGLGALDCDYEGPLPHYGHPTDYTPGGNRLPWTAHDAPSSLPTNTSTHHQSSAASPLVRLPWDIDPKASTATWRPPAPTASSSERVASPDPWFPKR